jgi:hypothetical protein
MMVFDLKGWSLENDPDSSPSGADIVTECVAVADLLLRKNKAYGDSALNPLRVFSKADAEEQVRVRLDDKLSRLMRGTGPELEDVEQDILGYLILARIARKRRALRPTIEQRYGESDEHFARRRAQVEEMAR